MKALDEDLREILELAERYLGGFMGSASAYEKVEELRARIRAKLEESDGVDSEKV